MIRYITLLCSLLFSTIIVAQNDSIYHNIAQLAIEKLNVYQSSSSFSRESKIDDYYDLFENNQVQVVNDILHLNEANSSISLKEYIKIIRNNYKRLNVSISINEIGQIDFSNEYSGTFDVFVTKKINGETINPDYQVMIQDLKEEYSEQISYRSSLDLVFKFYFNKDKIEIINISNSRKQNPNLILTPKIKYSLFSKKYNIEDLKVFVNSDSVLMQGFFHALDFNKSMMSLKPSHDLLLGKDEIKLKDVLGRNQKVHELVFKKSRTEFASSFGYNISPVSVSSESIDVAIDNDFSYSIMTSIRFNLSNILRSKSTFNSIVIDGKPISPLSVYLDLGYRMDVFSHRIYFDNYNYSYASIDSDGADYLRQINIASLSELQEIETSSLEASLLLNYKYDKFNFLVGTGIGRLNIDKSNFSSIATINYAGYYEDFFGLLIEQNGVYDFGSYEITQNGTLDSYSDITTSSFMINIDYELSKRLLVGLGTNYIFSKDSYFKRNDNYLSENNLNLNSISNNINYTFNYFSIAIGLKIKL